MGIAIFQSIQTVHDEMSFVVVFYATRYREIIREWKYLTNDDFSRTCLSCLLDGASTLEYVLAQGWF